MLDEDDLLGDDVTHEDRTRKLGKKNHESNSKAPTYAFTHRQWDFINDEQPNVSSKGVDNKVEQLPYRVAELLTDLYALSQSSEYPQNPDELADRIEQRAQAAAFQLGGDPNDSIGFMLGRIAAFLMQIGDNTDYTQISADFLRGLLYDVDELIVAELLSKLEEYDVSEMRTHPAIQGLQQRQMAAAKRGLTHYNIAIEEGLKYADLPVTDTIKNHVEKAGEYRRKLILSEEDKEHNYREVLCAIDEIDDQFGVDNVRTLIDTVHTDVDTVRNEVIRGVDGYNVFRQVARADTAISETSISTENRTPAEVLKKLSGQSMPQYVSRGEQWTDRPIIEQQSADTWTTTHWGDLVMTVAQRTSEPVKDDEETDLDEVADIIYSVLFSTGYLNAILTEAVDHGVDQGAALPDRLAATDAFGTDRS